DRVLRILVAGIGAEDVGSRALEIAEGGAAPGVEQRLDGGVRMLRRVMDLRDVVHGRDAVVELRQTAEQLADVDVLRTVYGGESEENVLEVVDSGRRRAVEDENAVGQEAPQRRLELVVMRVDEAGHHDLATRIDLRRVAGVQVRPDPEDLLALDQN